MPDPLLSVIIPSWNTPRWHLERLDASLGAQELVDFEVLVVDDGSAWDHYGALTDPRIRVIRRGGNAGPATCRNAGARAARAPALFFTDADCALEPTTLAVALRAVTKDPIVMGDTWTEVRTRLGRAVAYLGFPGGGSLGFQQVWRVDGEGYTGSISSCNVCIRREVFEALGGFDEDFPVAGGEDTALARRALARGHRIRFEPAQRIAHVERGDLGGFVRWQLVRGRGNFHIKRRLGSVEGFLSLRAWSYANALRAAGPRYAPAVATLIGASTLLQTLGYMAERHRRREP